MNEHSAKSVGNTSGGGGHSKSCPGLEDEKLCYTIPEVAKLLGLSRNFGYELARRGEIPIVTFGKRKLVPKVALERMLGQYIEREVKNEGAH